jgi:2,3-bisphosphoglycerate-independent phosphoglycerate mutase
VGEHAPSATAAIEAAYARGISDEFVPPTIIDRPGHPAGATDGPLSDGPSDGPLSDGPLSDGEPIVVANFRADRARQLVHALADVDFAGFGRATSDGRPAPDELDVVTMTEYEAALPVRIAFPPEVVPCLAGAIADAGWRQLHVAETEKYAHVTYFLNGGREAPFEGEDRVLVPSPRVATYDLQPEMSAPGVADALVNGIASGAYDVLIANFANPDMVGHTGDWDATIRAVEAVDAALGRVADELGLGRAVPMAAVPPAPGANDLLATDALLVVTADHGNADAMRTPDGSPITAHSLNPVPILIAGRAVSGRSLADGVLADVAPTLLELAALPPWPGITGRSLLRD